MIPKNFEDIAKADIDYLVDNKIGEIKTLEYKQELPGGQDKDRKEFLADLSSFANASGGDLIYGIKGAVDENGKNTGEPEVVVPVQGVNPDQAKLWIEDIVRAGIEPRMLIHVKAIAGYGDDGNGFVILIRIPQSFASPHMVKFGKTSRFYCRSSAGKYQLDVHEIRNAFLATDSQAERIRSFLQDRLAKIMADETPLRLSTPHRLILHIMPLNSFLNRKRLDLSDEHKMQSNFVPIAVNSWSHRYNLDGFLAYRSDRNTGICDSYCQVFFDGIIEAVNTNILRVKDEETPKKDDTTFILSKSYEVVVVRAIKGYCKGYKTLGIDAPLVISMSLLGYKGAYMWTDFYGSDSHPIDRDVVLLPEVTADSFDEEVPSIMKPIFDAVGNACGLPGSPNYTKNGTWNVRQW